MPKMFMTQKTRYRLSRLLEAVLLDNEDGTVSYKDDWDDQKVAEAVKEETGEELVAHHVSRQRQRLFGKLGSPNAPTGDSLEVRVSSIEQVLKKLCDQLGVHCVIE